MPKASNRAAPEMHITRRVERVKFDLLCACAFAFLGFAAVYVPSFRTCAQAHLCAPHRIVRIRLRSELFYVTAKCSRIRRCLRCLFLAVSCERFFLFFNCKISEYFSYNHAKKCIRKIKLLIVVYVERRRCATLRILCASPSPPTAARRRRL